MAASQTLDPRDIVLSDGTVVRLPGADAPLDEHERELRRRFIEEIILRRQPNKVE